MKKIILLLFLVSISISCKDTVNKSEEKQPIVAASYKTVAMDIEGMTCEIGCARTIQSKVSKIEGVTYSKVDFDAKKGYFTYDQHKINDEFIAKKIKGIAGGNLYRVMKTIELKEIIK